MSFRPAWSAALLLVAQLAQADGYTVVPERFIYCTTCHGVELQGNPSVDAPRLAGMADWYVTGQLEAFKEGWRGTHPDDPTGMEMQPQAAVLTDDDIRDAAAFVASIPERGQRIEHTVSGDPSRGRRLYQSCAACHGADARGSKVLNAPALVGQSDWYLVRQLDNYLSGTRGYAPADTGGQQMRAAVALLTDDAAVRDVVVYINTLRREP